MSTVNRQLKPYRPCDISIVDTTVITGSVYGHRGVGTLVQGTGSIVPPYPTGSAVGDLNIIFVETAPAIVIATPAGWTLLYESEGDNGASIAYIFYRIKQLGDTAPTITSSSARTQAFILGVQGANQSTPFDVTFFNANVTGAGGTALTITGVTTTATNELVYVGVTSNSLNAGAYYSGWTNANLAGLAEIVDVGGTTFGHIGIAYGTKATAGATGNTTLTAGNNSSFGAMWSLAIKSSGGISATGQVALSWKLRNRLTNTTIRKNTATSDTAEVGQTTTIRVYNAANTLVRTVTGITGTTYDYTALMESADNAGVQQTSLRFEIESVRDGNVSFQKHNITLTR